MAIIIYVTLDECGQPVRDGTVLFADIGVLTGKDADRIGIWLFPVPEGGVFVDEAHVRYIKKKNH